MKPRPIKITGDVAIIPLTQGYEAFIDAADVPLVDGHSWTSLVRKNTTYAYTSVGPRMARKTVYLHRLLMNAPDGMQVDHRDCNGLNNRKANMRIATHAQNQHNRKKSTANTSGIKGVYWNVSNKKWRARIKFENKQIHLGYFTSLDVAHAAYCEASARLHGEFGRVE